jgi:hypothetical protein
LFFICISDTDGDDDIGEGDEPVSRPETPRPSTSNQATRGKILNKF